MTSERDVVHKTNKTEYFEKLTWNLPNLKITSSTASSSVLGDASLYFYSLSQRNLAQFSHEYLYKIVICVVHRRTVWWLYLVAVCVYAGQSSTGETWRRIWRRMPGMLIDRPSMRRMLSCLWRGEVDCRGEVFHFHFQLASHGGLKTENLW